MIDNQKQLDKNMSLDELATKMFLDLKNDFPWFAEKCLKIRPKDGSLIPLKLNKAQRYIHDKLEEQLKETGKVRAIILKGRQQGASTYVEARLFHRIVFNRGKRTFILTHSKEATDAIFNITKRYYDNLPEIVKPSISKTNIKELVFDSLDSSYGVSTAGAQGTGRGQTIQYLHGSEVPLWHKAAEHAQGLMQAVPNSPGTEIILEGTAKGEGNYFHQQWQLAERGLSDYIAIFVPWFWQDEYRTEIRGEFRITKDEQEIRDLYNLSNEQMLWRRNTIAEFSSNFIEGERRFKEEYPCTPAEAFQHAQGEESFIPALIVNQARKEKENIQRIGPILVGVDPARFGDDRTSIVRRQGRVVYGLASYRKYDTMQVAGLVYQIIKDENPAKVFIDVVGLGAGVVDRLKEMGFGDKIMAVNAGSSPLNGEIYFNKRAEMWGEMLKWLEDGPVMIPDSTTLASDLCAPSYIHDSKHRLQIEKKEDMRKKGLQSPDEADALALTFAFPVRTNSFDVDRFYNPTIRL
jgi:hypothetical protein